jgi:hypothetical protein
VSSFVFMLTHGDLTVPDAADVCGEIASLEIDIVGFKDVGVPMSELVRITDRLREQGRTVALEVVSQHRDDELRSVEAGMELGVDLLLGGVNVRDALALLGANGADGPRYMPFPGQVVGHPSVLVGTIAEIAQSARDIAARDGVWGLDLLAYRFDGDVDQLVREVVGAVDVPVVVAGSIDSEERVRAVVDAGAWGFTVGTAAFERRFLPGASLGDQLRFVIDVAGEAAAGAR